jgi:predicted MPP superfamily phosphohydrolase
MKKLIIGHNSDFEIREYLLDFKELKDISILFLSDLHFNRWSAVIAKKLTEKIEELNPTIICLGGDYLDSGKGFSILASFLENISQNRTIISVMGNHDIFWKKKLSSLFKNLKINTLEEKNSEIILLKQLKFTCQNSVQNDSFFTILLSHKPITQVVSGINLTLSGHLHGCQFVFWQKSGNLYPGKLLYKNNYLDKKSNGTLQLVSKGLGDTIPIRYNCTKDLILITFR